MRVEGSKRLWIGMIGLLVVLGAAIVGAGYIANSVLQKQSQKMVSFKLQNQVINQEQLDLAKAKQDIAAYSPLNTIAKTIVPQDKDQAEAVREIVNIGGSNGITLSSVSFAASSLGGAGGTSSSSSGTNVPLTQVQPVPTIHGVYELPITIQQDANSPITYNQFLKFLQAIENNRRTAQVSSINIQPTADHVHLVFTLQLNEYIKPTP